MSRKGTKMSLDQFNAISNGKNQKPPVVLPAVIHVEKREIVSFKSILEEEVLVDEKKHKNKMKIGGKKFKGTKLQIGNVSSSAQKPESFREFVENQKKENERLRFDHDKLFKSFESMDFYERPSSYISAVTSRRPESREDESTDISIPELMFNLGA